MLELYRSHEVDSIRPGLIWWHYRRLIQILNMLVNIEVCDTPWNNFTNICPVLLRLHIKTYCVLILWISSHTIAFFLDNFSSFGWLRVVGHTYLIDLLPMTASEAVCWDFLVHSDWCYCAMMSSRLLHFLLLDSQKRVVVLLLSFGAFWVLSLVTTLSS